MKDDRFRIDFVALVLDFFTFGIYSGYHNIQRIENSQKKTISSVNN